MCPVLTSETSTYPQVKKLQAILKPMMLRRLKDDVEKNLAPKQETIIEVELTNIQKKYYRAILEKNFAFLAKGANQHNMPNLINTMMELRKCCNHPYLITGDIWCLDQVWIWNILFAVLYISVAIPLIWMADVVSHLPSVRCWRKDPWELQENLQFWGCRFSAAGNDPGCW